MLVLLCADVLRGMFFSSFLSRVVLLCTVMFDVSGARTYAGDTSTKERNNIVNYAVLWLVKT